MGVFQYNNLTTGQVHEDNYCYEFKPDFTLLMDVKELISSLSP